MSGGWWGWGVGGLGVGGLRIGDWELWLGECRMMGSSIWMDGVERVKAGGKKKGGRMGLCIDSSINNKYRN